METKVKTVSFAMSGTLGDAFTVFCKLAGYYQHTGHNIRLYRYSTYPEFDGVISEFFSVIPYIKYITPSFKIKWSDNTMADCEKMVAPHISSVWNGKNAPYCPDDPQDVYFEPYPEVPVGHTNKKDNRYAIGIQLQTGKVSGNFKGFSLKWISGLRKWLPEREFAIFMLGTGAGYSLKQVDSFCKRYRIENLVGKTTFVDWMSYIKTMDYFITPEGFSAFFAMSQKVRSLVFFTDYQILGRVHPVWRRENIILSAGHETIPARVINRVCRKTINRNCLLKPLKPAQVSSLVKGETIYI